MIGFIKNVYLNNKKIIENFSYLSLLQIFSLLFPLITYPYLLRILGFQVYGSIIFAQSLTMFIAIVINFGFNISATKEIACNRNDKSEISKIVSSVYSLKFFLWLLCLLLYFLAIYFVPFLRKDWLLYVLSFFISFNDLLFPIWFFQGIEKMKYITFINIGVRFLFVLAVFLLVNAKEDYLLVPLLNSIGAFLGGIISIYVVFYIEGIRFMKQSIKTLKLVFLDSFPLFLSSLSTQIYVKSNKVLVGSFLGMEDVAVYDLGEKITSILKIPVGMISQATFPKISRDKNIKFVNKIMLLTTATISLLYIIVYFSSGIIVELLSGNTNDRAEDILRILALSVILSGLNLFLGGNRLLPFGFKKYYVMNTIFTCIFYFVGFGFLWIINIIDLYTVSYMYLLTECFMLLLNVYRNKKFNLLF